ncbi:MAG TPA: M28 family peptidase, partial [Propionibacteriaceae bacterium]|nr:M28 family peptidase [Propionibacteriaceae bacterium]
MRRTAVLTAALIALLTGCTSDPETAPPAASTPAATTAPPTVQSPTPSPAPSATPSAPPTPKPKPVRFDARRVERDIRHLAVDIGPREATSRNFAEAADWVERRLERLGYRVRRTRVSVPAGNSWGTPVRRGTSVNVIAEPRGFDRRSAHVVVGAHLDTVPVAPGAEDNASGVAVMLELARLAAAEPTDRP